MSDNKNFYNEILIEHNQNPFHKHELETANMELRGYNPTCGDDVTVKLQVENGIIVNGSFVGSGCAISQASTDMMLDLIIGKTEEEALRLVEIFTRMIKGKISEEELEELEEAGSLIDVSHMPARVKCAVLGWHALGEMLDKDED